MGFWKFIKSFLTKVLIDVILTDGKNMIANKYKMVNVYNEHYIDIVEKRRYNDNQ